MKIKPIFADNFTIAVRVQVREDAGMVSEVEEFLKAHLDTKQFGANVRGLLKLMQDFSVDGSKKLTSQQFHQADDSGLWRFSKGRLRIYCMRDEQDNLILLTGALVKKTQPTERSVIRQAKSLWSDYQKAKKEGTLEVVGVES